jgi:photosystem II stability/assembly factor-like uncharacterized protein
MRLGSPAGRLGAVIAISALLAMSCSAPQNRVAPAALGTTSTQSTTTSPLFPTSTLPVTAPTNPPLYGPWEYATANLAGLASECGNMTLLSARPDRDIVIAGVARQGLLASVNGATTWTRLGQGAGSAVIINRPSSITYDPSHPNTFWESGLYNGGGLYETTDNGIIFKQLGNLVHSDLVSVDLSDPARSTLLSGRHEQSKLFRSGDGGATWVDLSSKLPAGVGFTTSPLVLDSHLHLLGTRFLPTSGVFRTTDGGASWTRVYQGAVSGPALVAKSDGAIYWLLDNGNGLIRSNDKGLTWRTVTSAGMFSPFASSLIELPDGRLATFSSSVIVSADHGSTWRPIGQPLPYVPTGIIYAPSRMAFYAWKFDCNFSGDTSVKPNAIVRFNFDFRAH